MALASPGSTTTIVSELWAQVRALADRRDIELDLRLLGKPVGVPTGARDIIQATAEAVIESASSALELRHLALELSYGPENVQVRIEHDAGLEAEARAATEQTILELYADIGSLGGTLSLSSGRGFGMRVELSLPLSVEREPHLIRERGAGATTFPPPPRATSAPLPLVERLTPQEEVCLSLLAAGLSNKEIAHRMHLGVGTVKFHLAQIYQKLGVQGRGRGAAVARARELGLLFD